MICNTCLAPDTNVDIDYQDATIYFTLLVCNKGPASDTEVDLD